MDVPQQVPDRFRSLLPRGTHAVGRGEGHDEGVDALFKVFSPYVNDVGSDPEAVSGDTDSIKTAKIQCSRPDTVLF